MKIKKKFLELTKNTYPHGYETFLESQLPSGAEIDDYGNYYISIGDSYTTMFTCHLDTACKDMVLVSHLISPDGMISTDGTSILGADDKAGMVVVLYMIEKKIPGLYYFFIGEEVGCVGSREVAGSMEKSGNNYINKVISFDRRGTDSVITDMFYGTCCSDKFADSLCFELNKSGLDMKPDNTGILTDSAQFMGFIPECTNISVGYYNEHTVRECQDIEFLYKLCNAVSNVDWESLIVDRDPKSSDNWYNYWEDEEPVEDRHSFWSNKEEGDLTFSGKDYSFILDKSGSRLKAYISEQWILHEKTLIRQSLIKQGYNVERVHWDGTNCCLLETGSEMSQFIGSRSDLIEFIDKFDVIPVAHIRYYLHELN